MLRWKALGRWSKHLQTRAVTAWWIPHAGPNCRVVIQPLPRQTSPHSQQLGRGWGLQGEMLSQEPSPPIATAVAPTAGWEMPRFSNCPKKSSKQVLQLMHRWRYCGKGFVCVCVRRPLALLSAKLKAGVSGRQRRLRQSGSQSSPQLRGSLDSPAWSGLGCSQHLG